jgi:F-box/leucine-rich repeat protein 7
VTGVGVEAVVEGCHRLEVFDVSQCKNLTRWLETGGREKARRLWKRNVRFEVVASEEKGRRLLR